MYLHFIYNVLYAQYVSKCLDNMVIWSLIRRDSSVWKDNKMSEFIRHKHLFGSPYCETSVHSVQ